MARLCANQLCKTYRPERGSYGVLKLENGDIKDASSGYAIQVPIGTSANDLHIGDLVFLDYGYPSSPADGVINHTTVLAEDKGVSGFLDGQDVLIFAGHQGVEKKSLSAECPFAEARIYLRVGW